MAQTTPINTTHQMALTLRKHTADVSREEMRCAWRESQLGAMGYGFEDSLSIPEFACLLRLRAAARSNGNGGRQC